MQIVIQFIIAALIIHRESLTSIVNCEKYKIKNFSLDFTPHIYYS